MRLTTCPSCGQPLRPGTKFCGSCGVRISGAVLPATDHVSPEFSSVCPRCGKTIRIEARFCNYCGFEIRQRREDVQVLNEPIPGISDVPVEPPLKFSSRSGKPRSTASQAQYMAPKKRRIWFFTIIGVVVLCPLILAGAFFLTKGQFAWFKTPIPALASAALDSPTPRETNTGFQTAEGTAAIPALETSSTMTVAPAIPIETTPGEAAMTEAPKTASAAAVRATLSAPPVAEIIVLLEDNFSEPLNNNWKVWGDPRPTIRTGFGDSWLDLKAAEEPGRAGVTSRLELEDSQGIAVEFEAQLNSSYPQFPIHFDWDPVQFIRGPENVEPTIVHLEIQRSQLFLQTPVARKSCQQSVDGREKHLYLIQFIDKKDVEIYVDSAEEPLCRMEMGVKLTSGRISFTGNGWITRIQVSSGLNR